MANVLLKSGPISLENIRCFRNSTLVTVLLFRIVEKLSAEIDSFSPQLLELKNEIEQFQDQIFILQSQRQNDVWTLLERAVNYYLITLNYVDLQLLAMQVTLWQRTSMMNQQNLPPAAGETNLLSIPSLSPRETEAQESMMAIQENQSLRYQ